MRLLNLHPHGRRNVRNLALILVGLIVLAGIGSMVPQSRELLAVVTGNQPEDGPPTIRASNLAFDDIPIGYLGLYVNAAEDACPNLSWQLLAGVGKVETNHGRSTLPGVREGLNEAGCCAGPMQFNLTNGPPSTWQGIGRDYNRDGTTNVYDPADAIPAAARKLCANGIHPTPDNRTWKGALDADPCPNVRGSAAEHRALRRYNNACWYAHDVLEFAAQYTTGRPTPPTQDPYVRALLDNPRLSTTDERGCDPAPDLASGKLDIRVRSLLTLLTDHFDIRVSCLQTGHSRNVAGANRVSNHHVWRAVDIDMVNGQPVNAGNPHARRLAEFLDTVSGALRPSEIDSPFTFGREPYFTDSGHQGHLHVGYGDYHT